MSGGSENGVLVVKWEILVSLETTTPRVRRESTVISRHWVLIKNITKKNLMLWFLYSVEKFLRY
jgi:hypothetical protein